MTAGEILLWPVTWLTFFVAFIGSLFACRDWPMRVFFSLVMPIVYAFVWTICYLALGSMVALVSRDMQSDSFSLLTGVLTTAVTTGVFVLQVVSMARDSKSLTVGYALGAGGRGSIRKESTLSRIPTKKRWGG